MTTVTYTGYYFIKESSKNLQKLNSYTCLEISRTGKKKKEGNKTSKNGAIYIKNENKNKKNLLVVIGPGVEIYSLGFIYFLIMRKLSEI